MVIARKLDNNLLGFNQTQMAKFRNFPRGKVTLTPWFYLTAFVLAVFILIGLDGIISQEIEMKSKHIFIQGEEAVLIGYIFVFFGVFSLYHLLFKTKKIEESLTDYHDLEEFEEQINNYHTKFEYIATATLRGNSSVLIGYAYKLSLKFNRTIKLNLSIKQRDKLEYFLWKIGLTRKFDILTGFTYFLLPQNSVGFALLQVPGEKLSHLFGQSWVVDERAEAGQQSIGFGH